jgi:hypothetical protein
MTMKHSLQRILIWTPRVLGVLFAFFVSIFALDVFGQGYGFLDTILVLFMHLIPVYILLAALAIAWRWEWAGAVLFASFSVWYVVVSWGRLPLAANLIGVWPIAGPSLLIGLLFLLNWIYKPNLHSST